MLYDRFLIIWSCSFSFWLAHLISYSLRAIMLFNSSICPLSFYWHELLSRMANCNNPLYYFYLLSSDLLFYSFYSTFSNLLVIWLKLPYAFIFCSSISHIIYCLSFYSSHIRLFNRMPSAQLSSKSSPTPFSSFESSSILMILLFDCLTSSFIKLSLSSSCLWMALHSISFSYNWCCKCSLSA